MVLNLPLDQSKFRILSFFGVVLSLIFLLGSSNNPPNGHTGAPGEGLCVNCHSGNNPINGVISISGLPAVVNPQTAYDITVTLTRTAGTPIRGGFQLVALDGNNANVGTFSNPGSNVAFESAGGRTYAEHRPFKNFNGNDEVEFTFTWNSPAVVPGNTVKMFFSGVLANGNGGSSGDRGVNANVEANFQAAANDPEVEIVNVVNVSCFGGSNGSATAQASQGVPPYMYNWSNGAQTSTINNLSAGTYSVTVTDSNNGTTSASVTITQPDQLSVVALAVPTINCFNPNGEISVEASGGSPPYEYAWSNGASGPVINVSSGGNYTVTVTDANFCTSSLTVNVNQDLNNPVISAGPDLEIPCFGGSVILQGNGPGGGNFLIEWTTADGNILSGQNTYNPMVNMAGTYVLTVINTTNGCTSTDTTIVSGPPAALSLNFNIQDVSCFGASDGELIALVGGGKPPYQYLWSNNANSPILSNIAAGNYSLTVTDDNGCNISGQAMVRQPMALSVQVLVTPVSGPEENDGKAEAVPSGGTLPYQYLWSNGATSQIIEDLTPGTYLVTVTDGNNCQEIGSGIIPPFDCELTVQLISKTDLSCFESADGIIEIAGEGGSGELTFVWSHNETGPLLTGLSAGTYQVTATDEVGCTATLSVEVFQPDEIIVQTSVVPISNAGEMDASITATASGGVGIFTFQWSNGATGETIENLGPGIYGLTITDETGCTKERMIIVQPFECEIELEWTLVQAILCHGDNDGAVSVTITGGFEPYNVVWSNGQTGLLVEQLPAGLYTITVTDLLECTQSAEITLSQPDSISVEILDFSAQIGQEGEGRIEIRIDGGVTPYEVKWFFDNNEFAINVLRLTNLNSGRYTLEVVDANGCELPSIDFTIHLQVSIRELSDDIELKVFPNPVNSELFLEFNDPNFIVRSLELMNTQGLNYRLPINEGFVNSGRLWLSLEQFPSGLYLIKASTNQGDFYAKIIVHR